MLARYRQSVLHAAEDVENAFLRLTQTELRTQQLQEEVASLTTACDLSQQSYEAGTIALTDVLDAARAAARPFRALGGGRAAQVFCSGV